MKKVQYSLTKTNNKGNMKRLGIISLVALGSLGASGTTVFLGMNQIHNAGNGSADVVVPPIEDVEPVEESDFSKMLNGLIGAKNIHIDELDIAVNPGSTTEDSAMIKLIGLNVDMTQMNTSVINLSTTVEISYGGLNQSLGLAIEDNTYAYVNFKGKSYRINAIHSIDDVVKALKNIGVKMPSMSTGGLDVSSILDKVTAAMGDLDIVSTGNAFSIDLGELSINENTSLSNLKINLNTTNEHQLSGLEVASVTNPVTLNSQGEQLVSFYIRTVAAEGSVNAVSLDSHDYVSASSSAYTDVTDPNASVFTSIANIFNVDENNIVSAKSNIGLAIDLKKTQQDATDTDFMSFDGGLQIDSSDVSKIMSNAKFRFDLNNRKTVNNSGDLADPLDTLSAYYDGGSMNAAYINLNNDIKAKIKNTTSKELINYIADADGGQKAITNIASQLGKTLDSLPMDSFKNLSKKDKITSDDVNKIADTIKGYMGTANDVLDSFTFDYDSTDCSFIITLGSTALGITKTEEDAFTIEVRVNLKKSANGKLDTVTKGIQSIVVSGIKIGDIKTSITLTPKEVEADETGNLGFFSVVKEAEYTDLEPVAGVFRTVGDFFANKKGSVDYTFNYIDKNGTDTKASYQANGSIGADLTDVDSITAFDDVLSEEKNTRGLKNGSYYLSMNLNTGADTLAHNVELSYQNNDDSSTGHSLFFSYNDVFKNRIEDAEINDIINVLGNKTDSNKSAVTLDTINNVLTTLKANDTFINDLKAVTEQHTIKGLTSFISLTNPTDGDSVDTTKLILKVNTDRIFSADSIFGNLGALTIEIDTSKVDVEDSDPIHYLDSIMITGLVSSPDIMNLTINFNDYQEHKVSFADIDEYPAIQDASEIVSSFYNLPTKMENYSLAVAADVSKLKANEDGSINTASSKSVLSMDGDVRIDKNGGYYGGTVNLRHDSLSKLDNPDAQKATQKIEFAYETKDEHGNDIDNPQFAAEYNDKMHILMHKNSVKDLIQTVSDDASSSHLALNSLDTAQDVATGLPITKVIKNKDASILLKYQYIYKVDFNDDDDSITIYLDRSLFDEHAASHDDSDAAKLTIRYSHEAGKDPELTSVAIDFALTNTTTSKYTQTTDSNGNTVVSYHENTKVSGQTKVSASISFKPVEEFVKPTVATVKDASNSNELFIDMDSENIKRLIQSGIATTNYNYYHIGGQVCLDISANLDEDASWKLRQYSFDLGLDFTLYLADNTVYMDLSINNGLFNRDENGYSKSEYRIAGDYVYFTKATNKDGTLTSENYRTTKQNLSENLPYYALSKTLDFDDKIAGRTLIAQIYNGISATKDESEDTSITMPSGFTLGLKDDFSGIISSLDTDALDDGLNKYSANFNLGSLLDDTSTLKDMLSFGNCGIALYDQKVTDADGNVSNPFYGATFDINLGLLPFTKTKDGVEKTLNLAEISLRGALKSQVGNDMIADENGEIKDTKMANYFSFINKFDSEIAAGTRADYQIDGYTLLSKEVYDFTNWELSSFINDYRVNDNYDGSVYVITTDNIAEAEDIYF